jgi:hypothetical protein
VSLSRARAIERNVVNVIVEREAGMFVVQHNGDGV